MIDWSTCPAVEQVPGKVSAAPGCSRIFLDWFEGVEDWQVRAVLTHLESGLLKDLKRETAV